jgi:hypothetical protein
MQKEHKPSVESKHYSMQRSARKEIIASLDLRNLKHIQQLPIILF